MNRLATGIVFGLAVALSIGAGYDVLERINGDLIVSQGNFGHSALNKFGFNTAITNAREESVWEGDDTAYTANDAPRCPTDTTAFTLNISSDAAGDTEIIEVNGLDENWDNQTVNVTLAGLTFTQVGDAGGWMRVNRAKNTGATDLVGTVYLHTDTADAAVADGVPDDGDDVKAVITAAENQTLQACYTVPDGYTFYLTNTCFSNIATGTGIIAPRLRVHPQGAVGRVQLRFSLASGANECPRVFVPPLKYTSRTMLESTAIVVGAGTADVAATFGGYILLD